VTEMRTHIRAIRDIVDTHALHTHNINHSDNTTPLHFFHAQNYSKCI
jgi:hypothetical protein